ncbi:MAG: helix-turn-helix transcriptional regulator [Erysipelotrichaceae bacterium]|nr:helix-turn-helix transcriptional regulator [Erysipelotrichaceae bacterium]
MKLKNRVKELRARNNINQQDLATRVNVSRQTISSIEGGNYHPSILLALIIAKEFNVSVNELFYLEEDNEN